MSAKHTPGKWNWYSDPVKGDPYGRVRYQVKTVGKTIAKTYYASDDPHAEWDARLIAAAPDLLEALENALTLLWPSSDEYQAACAAIARAKGEA